MLRICLDLKVWCAGLLAERAGRRATASRALVEAMRGGYSSGNAHHLVVSWGMIANLETVLADRLGFASGEAARIARTIIEHAQGPPSLTLGGVGVIPVRDQEDRHVLETVWAGQADVLVTSNLRDFLQPRDELVIEGRLYRLRRGGAAMMLAHPFEAAHWLREGVWRTRP